MLQIANRLPINRAAEKLSDFVLKSRCSVSRAKRPRNPKANKAAPEIGGAPVAHG
jgi:hypothetical protein